MYIYRMLNGSSRVAEVQMFIDRHRPTTLDGPPAQLVREVVALAQPQSIDRAKTLLWTCAQIVKLAQSAGLELSPQVLFHPSTIERLLQGFTGHMSPPSRRTLRTNLRHLATKVLPGSYPQAQPLSREHCKKPYSKSELAAYLALADAQPTQGRKMRAGALICLGAGSGLVGRELAYVRGCDVVSRCGGVLVQVAGRRQRVVPVLCDFQDRLLASAAWAGNGFVIGGVDPARRNVTTQLVGSLSGGIDLPRLETGRLRATWLAVVADMIGIPTFMAAAGIHCSQRLGDIIAGLQPCDEAR
ncbi:MAG: hypothetical protein ACRDIA_08610, partial [Actinomycetota bacterium]